MITSNLIKILPHKLRAKVENNHELRKILGNINWLTAGVIFKDVIGLFLVAWVARYLGPEQFGTMNYAVAFVALFSTLSTLGLDNIVIRNILLKPENKAKYLGTTFVLKLLGSLIMLLLSSLVIYFVQPDNTLIRLFVFIIAFGYIFKAFDIIDFWFQSKIEAKYAVYARSISFILVSILKVIFILTQSPLVAFVLMFTLDFLLTALFFLYFYIKKEKTNIKSWKISFDTAKELLKDSWPLILSGIAVTIYMKIDQVLIGNMLGGIELGLYSAASKLSVAWYFIPGVVMSSVFPAIIEAKKKNENLYFKRMQTLYNIFTCFTIVVALVVTFSSSFIIKNLYGNAYLGAAKVLSIHIWAGVFVFFGVANTGFTIPQNLMKYTLWRTLIGVVINISLNIILIPKFGIVGVAVVAFISHLFTDSLLHLLFKKTRFIFLVQLKSFNPISMIKSNFKYDKDFNEEI